VLESELDGLLAAAETLQVKGLSNVRNKYEKGDIQCADNQQNQQQQQQQQQPQQQQQLQLHDDQDEKTDGSSQGTPLHLRRKRRKLSESPVSVMYEFISNLGEKTSSQCSDCAVGWMIWVLNLDRDKRSFSS
jgi:hypothetical protein